MSERAAASLSAGSRGSTEAAALRRRLTALSVVFLVVVFGLRLFDSANRNSLTVDEPHYIGTGLYIWQSGDYDYKDTLLFHPPLSYHLASLPLLLLDLENTPVARDVGSRLLARDDLPAGRVRLLSRLSFVLLACWGAVLVALFAAEAAGSWACLIATLLYTGSPLLLAHSTIAHSDITVTIFGLQLIYSFWRWWRRPGALRFLLCGVALGLALLSKMNALLFLPAIGLLLLLDAHGLLAGDEPATDRPRRPNLLATARLLGLLALAVPVIWLGYGGSFALAPIETGRFAGLRVPWFTHAVLFDMAVNEHGRAIYFNGQIASDGRFWYLIPIAWLLKTPIPTLILLFVSLCALGSARIRAQRGLLAALLLPIGVYLAIVVFALHVPLGVRYALPLVPLLHVFIATTVARLRPVRLLPIALCLVWLMAEGAWIHPHYLAYFNPLAGGPANAHELLVESNLDWGQDLGTLAEELERRGNPPVWLAYFGPEKPDDYGIRSRLLRGCQPVRGWVAISATYLHGLYSPGNPFRNSPPGCYDWLLEREPVAQPGYSILLYHIEDGPDRKR